MTGWQILVVTLMVCTSLFQSCQRHLGAGATLRPIADVEHLHCFPILVEDHGHPAIVSIEAEVARSRGAPVHLDSGLHAIETQAGLDRAVTVLSKERAFTTITATLSDGVIRVCSDGKDDTFRSGYAVHRGEIVPLMAGSFARCDLGDALGWALQITTLLGLLTALAVAWAYQLRPPPSLSV